MKNAAPDKTPDASVTENHIKIGGFLKEAVFGFNDGLVSTFAVIAGLTAGMANEKIVLLGALATLFAGAFSMGLGTYLGSKSEKDLYESERQRELYEMKHVPELEEQEIREIYAAKGFKGELLEKVVAQIISDPDVWLQTMMTQELGFAGSPPNPKANGVIMSIAFSIGSLIPTFSYIFPLKDAAPFYGMPMAFVISMGASMVGLLIAGAYKTKFTKKNILLSTLESLIVGTLAAGGAYGIGLLFGV